MFLHYDEVGHYCFVNSHYQIASALVNASVNALAFGKCFLAVLAHKVNFTFYDSEKASVLHILLMFP